MSGDKISPGHNHHNFKFGLDDIVFYLKNNKICSASVLSRMVVENVHENLKAPDELRQIFCRFGDSGVFYSTYYGVFAEEDLFRTREELMNRN